MQIRPQPVVPVKKRRGGLWLGLTALMAVYGTVMYFRPLPAARLNLDLPQLPTTETVQLTWPAEGQAGVGAVGYDFFASNTTPHSVSTASMAKVITALSVLKKHPLADGQSGPTITMTAADVERLQQQLDQGGSHLLIQEGDTFSEYQMLEAMLLPSANNIADSLAIWAFGSLDAYRSFAQQYVTALGLSQTHIGPDASGFDPSTTSTIADLTALGKIVQQNPVLMKVAGTKSATFATAGTVYNTNDLLGNGVLTGLKTGMNEGNSGGFIFTANVTKGRTTIPVAGAIVNAGSSSRAVAEAESLARSMEHNFESVTFVQKNQTLGTARTAWGTSAPLTAKSSLNVVRWKANKLWHTEQLTATDATRSREVGTLTLRTNGAKTTTSILIAHPAAGPSFWWRILHVR